MAPKLDLYHQRFGRLCVVECIGVNAQQKAIWFCKCDCGNTTSVTRCHLKSGATVSCGCFGRERRTTHGDTTHLTQSSEHSVWTGMIQRCYNPKNNRYSDYGGRGITVCDSWRRSYTSFLQDMGRRPSAKHSIDRIENNGGYHKDNCHWATSTEQAHNRRPKKLHKFQTDMAL